MNKICVAAFAISSMLPGISSSSDHGLGISLKSADTSIYIPIEISDDIFIEPYFRYSSYDSEDSRSVVSTKNSSRRATLEAGAGIFKWVTNDSVLHPYYGIRVGYVNREDDYDYTYGSNDRSTNTELSGYSLAPAVGLTYKVINNLSIGFEAEWFYMSLDGSGTENVVGVETYTDTIKVSESITGTNTKVIIRYYY